MEKWLPIPDTKYEASSLGRIRSVDRVVMKGNRWGAVCPHRFKGKILSPWRDANGYETVYMENRKAVNVHRLVAIAFHGFRAGLEVNHIDGNKRNNCHDNLEWLSHSENGIHARDIGLIKDRKPLLAIPKNGGPAKLFTSASSAAREIGGGRRTIQSAAKGKFPTAYGYVWSYLNAA